MTDCEHCSETFADDAAYLRHLDDEHPEEMGRIERRRLEELGGGSGDGTPTALVVAALAVGALLVAIVLYTLTSGGSGANSDLGALGPAPDPPHELGPAGDDEVYQPYSIGGAHDHGPITVTVDGRTFDFRQPEFQHPREISAFHFEAGESRYHRHAKGVTLEYALEATAFGVTNTSFAYDGVVYREGSNATAPDGWEVVTNAEISYVVNGTEVSPETYVLQNSEPIEVVVESPGGTDGGANETTSSGTETSAGTTTTTYALPARAVDA